MNRKKQSKENIKRIAAMVCAILVALAFLVSVVSPALAVTQQQLDSAKKKTEQAKKEAAEAEKKRAGE